MQLYESGGEKVEKMGKATEVKRRNRLYEELTLVSLNGNLPEV